MYFISVHICNFVTLMNSVRCLQLENVIHFGSFFLRDRFFVRAIAFRVCYTARYLYLYLYFLIQQSVLHVASPVCRQHDCGMHTHIYIYIRPFLWSVKSFFETRIQRSTFSGLRSIVQLKTLAEHKGTGPR